MIEHDRSKVTLSLLGWFSGLEAFERTVSCRAGEAARFSVMFVGGLG